MINGNAPSLITDNDRTIVRIYWNILPSYSRDMVYALSSELNRKKIPFRFKVLNNPDQYPRTDAAVLYLDKEHYYKCKKSMYFELFAVSLLDEEYFSFPAQNSS